MSRTEDVARILPLHFCVFQRNSWEISVSSVRQRATVPKGWIRTVSERRHQTVAHHAVMTFGQRLPSQRFTVRTVIHSLASEATFISAPGSLRPKEVGLCQAPG